jgi:hypothetical protein
MSVTQTSRLAWLHRIFRCGDQDTIQDSELVGDDVERDDNETVSFCTIPFECQARIIDFAITTRHGQYEFNRSSIHARKRLQDLWKLARVSSGMFRHVYEASKKLKHELEEELRKTPTLPPLACSNCSLHVPWASWADLAIKYAHFDGCARKKDVVFYLDWDVHNSFLAFELMAMRDLLNRWSALYRATTTEGEAGTKLVGHTPQ